MAKKSLLKTEVTLADYKGFLKNSHTMTVIKNPDYYLKQYVYFQELANAMPCAIYLLDYTSQKYLFVSDGCKQITGFTSEEHMQMGQLEFYTRCMHKEDSKLFVDKVFVRFVESAKELSSNGLKNCRFSINYRINRKDGVLVKVLQQSVVLETTTEGYPLLSLGIIIDITSHKLDDKIVLSVSCYDETHGFKTISSNSYSAQEDSLTPREKEIIQHITFGHSSLKIAEILNISVLTVNAHRRNINKKTNCKNVAELVNYAINSGIS